jgi:hypothetical protein
VDVLVMVAVGVLVEDVLVIVAAVVLVDVLVIVAAVVLVVIAISREVWREVKWVPSGLNCCEKWPQSIRKKGGFPILVGAGNLRRLLPLHGHLLQALIPVKWPWVLPSTFNTYVQVKNIRNTISGLYLGPLSLFFLSPFCRVLCLIKLARVSSI